MNKRYRNIHIYLVAFLLSSCLFVYQVKAIPLSLNAQHCIQLSSKVTGYNDIESHLLKNTCTYNVWVHWCLRGGRDSCGTKKSFYAYQRKLKPNEEYSNWDSLPVKYSIEYGACLGKASAFVPTGSNQYFCELENIYQNSILECSKSAKNCSQILDSYPSKAIFDVKCPSGSKSVKMIRHNNVLMLESDSAKLTINFNQQGAFTDWAALCNEPILNTSNVDFVEKAVKKIAREFDKKASLVNYHKCLPSEPSDKEINFCANKYLKKHKRLYRVATSSGVRG